MSVKIRLKQTGKRNAKTYRVVVVDESKKRDGKVIEELGAVTVKGEILNLKKDRVQYWQSVGARSTIGMQKFLKQ